MSQGNQTIMTFVMQYMTNSLFSFIFICDKIKPYRKGSKVPCTEQLEISTVINQKSCL